MPPTCTVCRHEKRREITKELVLGTPYRDIARRFGISKDSAMRHRECISDALERLGDSDGITAREVLLELVQDLRTMAKQEKPGVGASKMFLEVADRLTRAADSFAKVNREVVTSTLHLFAQLGVRDEGEIRSALELARGAQHLTLDDCELDGVELLRMVLSQRPERRGAVLAALGRESSRAEVVESNGHTNGDAP